MQKSAKILGVLVCMLFVVALIVGNAIVRESNVHMLRVSFLDVGQGDSVFIQSPTGRQVLIDAGRNHATVRALAKKMSFFDRSIDVVIATHPDADHIGGFPDIFARYRVGLIVESSVKDSEGVDSAAFERAAQAEGAERMVAERGDRIDIGGGAYIEILFPDRDVPTIETNTGSIIARLVYENTAFLLTGDSPKAIEEYVVMLDADQLKSNVLKVGHHGSRTSSSLRFVGFVSPEYAIYSRGCDNDYGHPHDEVKETFTKLNIPTLDTCEDGTITFVSDGKTVAQD